MIVVGCIGKGYQCLAGRFVELHKKEKCFSTRIYYDVCGDYVALQIPLLRDLFPRGNRPRYDSVF